MRLHHLGIACEDIGPTLDFISKTQTVKSKTAIIYDPEQEASLCMVTLESGTAIELISGLKVQNLVKKYMFLYHTCWEVADLDRTISEYCANGCMIVSAPKPAVLFNQKRVAFLSSPLGIIELLEV